MDDSAKLEADIAIAKARMSGDIKDVAWMVGDGDEPEALMHAAIVLVYAQFETLVEAVGKGDEEWHQFLREALDECILNAKLQREH